MLKDRWIEQTESVKFLSDYLTAINRPMLDGEMKTIFAMCRNNDARQILIQKLQAGQITEIEAMIAEKNN